MKNFLLQVLASSIGFGIAVGACFALFLLLILAAAAGSPDAQHGVPKGAVLVVDLTKPYTDRGALAGNMSLSAALLTGGETPTALREATDAIRKASKDARISALYLRGGSAASGWATMRELALAVGDFRESGKPVVAWAPNWDEPTWYVAAAAKPLGMAPDGNVECDGLAAQVFYWAGAMKKLGVEVQVTRVGKYKSAVEPYLLESMSPENREQMEGFLGAIYRTFVDEATAARGLAAGTIEAAAASKGALDAKEAEAAGMIDRAMTYDELLAELAKASGAAGKDLPQVTLAAFAADVEAGATRSGAGGSVAVVFAEGTIVDGMDDADVGGDLVAQRLRKARLDGDVKAVVLRVNSPGGSAQASEAILREVKLTKAVKPVVVSMGDLAASGGYWIASLADEIVAHPSTITGSIGVFGMFPSVHGLAEQVGVKVEVVKTAPHADAMSPFRLRSSDELATVQRFVDRIYDDFLDRVSQGRSIPREQVQDLAQGRVWAGSQAMERKLVDAYGGLDEAVRRAAARAKLPAGHGVKYLEPEPEFLQLITRDLSGDEDQKLVRAIAEIPGVGGLAEAFRTVRTLRRGGVYARLPFELSIR
jgi:protease-4